MLVMASAEEIPREQYMETKRTVGLRNCQGSRMRNALRGLKAASREQEGRRFCKMAVELGLPSVLSWPHEATLQS